MEYICKYCNKTYKSIHSRSNHYRIYHKMESKPNVSLESVKIKPNVSLNIVNSNHDVNKGINNYKCKHCDKIYKHKQSKKDNFYQLYYLLT